MKKPKKRVRKPRDLYLENLVLFTDFVGWELACEQKLIGTLPLRPFLKGFAWGRQPRIARKIGKWFLQWADWYEQEGKRGK